MTSTINTALVMAQLQRNDWKPTSPPPKLLDTDLPRIGYTIGVTEDFLHAFMDVEAPRGGYDSEGRLVILYEPHVAYRAAPNSLVRNALVEAGLAYKSWGTKPYPKNSYARFAEAYAIHPETAIKACSMGRAQILGENFVVAGYDSPIDMYATLAMGGEAEHLEAAARFIKGNHLDDELRNQNWAGFARGYNGAQYAKNAYHTKLAARFKWWQGKPDTPWSPPDADGAIVVAPVPAPEPVVLVPPAPVVPLPNPIPAETAPVVELPIPMPGTPPAPVTPTPGVVEIPAPGSAAPSAGQTPTAVPSAGHEYPPIVPSAPRGFWGRIADALLRALTAR